MSNIETFTTPRDNNLAQNAIARELSEFNHIDLTIPAQRFVANNVRSRLGLSPLSQLRSGLVDARNERVADGSVSEYGDGATELMTPQTQPATEEQTAPQLGSQLRQKGAE